MKMRIKNILLLSVLIGSCGVVQSGPMDGIKLVHGFVEIMGEMITKSEAEERDKVMGIHGIVPNQYATDKEWIKFIKYAYGGYVYGSYLKSSPINQARQYIWYTYQSESELVSRDTIACLAEPLVYAVIDSNVEAGVNKLNGFDCVKNITKNIPQKHRSFIADNGKLVFGAAINRAWRVYTDQDIAGFSGEKLDKNLKVFAKDASMQVGCAVVEEYAIKPIVKNIINEDSLSRDVVSVVSAALNVAAYSAIISLVGK